jgi:polar amino acid transport system substrate-binding protein
MPVRSVIRRVAAPGAALILLALASAGCGGSQPSDSSPASTSAPTTSGAVAAAQQDPKVAAMVPAQVRSKGALVVAADASYAPNEFVDKDGRTIIGMDADLAAALAQVMGLRAQLVNVPFDSIVPGLAAGKYHLGMSSLTDTKEREQTVDMVTYFRAGNSFMIKHGSGISVNSLADLCGHTVAIEKGSSYVAEVTAQDRTCKAAGKQGVTMRQYSGQPAANLALLSGRAEVTIADSPVAAYQVKQSGGQLQVVGKPYGEAPYGIAVARQSGLAAPVLEAVRALMTQGVYQKILAKWGLADGAITTPVRNGAEG